MIGEGTCQRFSVLKSGAAAAGPFPSDGQRFEVGVFSRAVERLSLWLAGVGVVAIMAMMIAMFVDALARKVWKPIPGAFETNIGLMVVVMFLPQAFAQMRKAHVAMDLLNDRMGPRARAVIEGIAAVFAICVLAGLTYVSWGKAWHATAIGEMSGGGVAYPVWLFRWFLPLGLGVAILSFVDTAVNCFSNAIRRR